MTLERCTMAPLVEARRDGRLDAREVASVERHLAGCAPCRALLADLDRLTDAARRPATVSPTPLEHQRGRVALLRAAAGSELPRERAVRPRKLVLAAAVSLALIASVAAAGVARFGHPASRSGEGPGLRTDEPRVVLARRLPPRPTIAIDEAGTPARVEPRDEPRVLAGEASPGTLQRPRTEVAPAPAEPPKIEGTTVAARGPAARLAAGVPAARDVGARDAQPSAPPAPNGFAEGVRLVARGDYAAAAERLESYRAEHPGDAHGEDAAFLTVIALQRAGRRDEARAAAHRYLAQYPSGYRRAEAEAIAAGQ